ncbi:MAG: thiamine pyrophosphate-requiring protein [Alphaproteobacteria bacterium]|jgi:acetolactate synthase-1/2/3 large subunit|nr:thiamine pyrophosphate-requiring protein [Alphaproteobacteria bacterium]
MNITTGEALLRRFKALGIDFVFVNSGTDFPPIIEGLARAQGDEGAPLPIPVIAPHEHAAMGMAHGYYLATGRSQAVMVHTNVGLANAAIGALNAACEHIPTILCSGRAPVTESGRFGGRLNPINWGQEMRDQHALVREAVKWDFELRVPEQVADVVDRAYAIANSAPRGPVYLSLPREVLCETVPSERLAAPPQLAPSTPGPRTADIERAATILARAARPLIIGQRGPGGVDGFATLARLAEDWAIPVVEYWPTQISLSTGHPMHAGYDPGALLATADAVLVIDALTPWAPADHAPPVDCPVIQIGQDPLFTRTPVRGFRTDIALPGEVAPTLAALTDAMAARLDSRKDAIEARRPALIDSNSRLRAARRRRRAAADGGDGPMTKAWVARCVGDFSERHDSIVLAELGCQLPDMTLTRPGCYFQEPHSGGLGWGLTAALGIQLADRERLVVATVGDGSYMFANPVACHQIAEAYDLPVLTIVLNNSGWNAVRHATKALYPDGAAAKANVMPLTAFSPSPDFAKVAEANRGYAERVEPGCDLPAALERARHVIQHDRRQALLDIQVASD